MNKLSHSNNNIYTTTILSHTVLTNIIEKICQDDPVVYNLIRLCLVSKKWASTLVPQHFYLIRCSNFDQLIRLASKPIFNYPGARECKFVEIQVQRPSKNHHHHSHHHHHHGSSPNNNINQQTNISLISKLQTFLEKCPSIRSISFYSYSLEYENHFGHQLSEILKNGSLQQLTRLELMNMDLISHGSSTIIASLKNNTTLAELNLSRNFLKERDGLLLGDIIKHNNTLTKLDLSFNEFRISGLKSIIEALQFNQSITDINLEAVCRLDCMITGLTLSSPPLTPNSSNNISNSFTQISINSPIQSNILLTINGPSSFGGGSFGGFNNSPGGFMMAGTPPSFPNMISTSENWVPSSPSSISMNTKLIEGILHLKNNKNLKSLNLSHNTFGKQFNHSLGDLITHNRSITNLHLNYLKLDDECGAKVGRGLRTNQSIRTLSMIYNQLGKDSGFEIAYNMSFNTSVTHLFLSNNLFNEDIGVELSNMLRVNRVLVTLDLSDNNIGSNGAKSIIDGLKCNQTLTKFSFRNNKIGDNAGTYFASLFKENKTLLYLDLSFNHFQTNAGILMAISLESNSSLRHLYLSSNLMLEISNNSEANIKRCTQSLLNIFTKNKTLLTLELDGNSLPDQHLKDIRQQVQKNYSNLVNHGNSNNSSAGKKKKKGLFNILNLSKDKLEVSN